MEFVFVYGATSVMARPQEFVYGAMSVMARPQEFVHAATSVAANAPVIFAIAPMTGSPGTTVHMTVMGGNLAGTTALIFNLSGTPDSSINASNLTPNMTGDQLTADVVIGSAATPGDRVVIVQTPAGRSTAVYMGMTNVFTIP
jgi:hypothetical protein